MANLSNGKKIAIGGISVVAVAGIVCGVLKSSLISKAEASEIALGDAGLSEGEVTALRTKLDFDDGHFQYDVDFYSNGIEYEYTIQAKDGGVISRDVDGGNFVQRETPSQNTQQETSPESSEVPSDFSSQDSQAESVPNETPVSEAPVQSDIQSGEITLENAKEIALKDAGLAESDVTFTKQKSDIDNGVSIYDIEFVTADTEYDYEINALDGTVYEKSTESIQGAGANNQQSGEITLDDAKAIALSDAGLAETDVTFTKQDIDRDDGRTQYEIEFYYDQTEYEYTIDAVTGDILERDTDSHNI